MSAKSMVKEYEVHRTTKEIIAKQLFLSLRDGSKVALLLTKDDLEIVITALELWEEEPEAQQMAENLKQLRKATFGK